MGNDGTVYQLSDKQVFEIEKKKLAGLLKIDLQEVKQSVYNDFLTNFYRENRKLIDPKSRQMLR